MALTRPACGDTKQGLAAACALDARVDRELVQTGDIKMSVPLAFAVAFGFLQRDRADDAAIADRHKTLTEPYDAECMSANSDSMCSEFNIKFDVGTRDK